MTVFGIRLQISNDPRLRPASFVRTAFAVFVLLSGLQNTPAQIPTQWISGAPQEEILSRLRTVLPLGSTITQTRPGRTPDDWHTSDHRGFEIDGNTGQHRFQIWFLPLDWVGIRIPKAYRPRLVYWEGILADASNKIITNTEDVELHNSLQRLQAYTPSLVNGGTNLAQRLFKDRLGEVDQQTQALVRRFCRDNACRDEAAYSLIVLGVPARSLILACAEHGTAEAQGSSVSVLGYWKWPESLRILIGVASDPATPPRTQMYAAMALESIADPASGPALTMLLRQTKDSGAAEMAAEALGRIRYARAGPAILSRMERESSSRRFAQALASLQYKPAIPSIEKLCATTTFSSDWISDKQRENYLGWLPEIALMRLTGAWGPPSGGIRLLLVPPGHPVTMGSITTAVVIENVGSTDLDILGLPGHTIVDGKIFDDAPIAIVGNMTLRVNDVSPRGIHLSHLITTPGVHRVEYRFGTVTSNTLILSVP